MAGEVFKPRTDEREYRRVVLQNSLQVLLISDPDTYKAAASMDVGVGSFSDPEGLEGLAHFLASENTNFQFDMNADSLFEALDRFAQFFIKPLMSPDATAREIKAVDSEHQNNLLSDHWRISQLQKHLSKKDHPFHKFSTGEFLFLQDPTHIGIRVEEFLKTFESKMKDMTNDEFKLEKDKNLWEESGFYWHEIKAETLKFDRRECEVALLRDLSQECKDFFNTYVRVGWRPSK